MKIFKYLFSLYKSSLIKNDQIIKKLGISKFAKRELALKVEKYDNKSLCARRTVFNVLKERIISSNSTLNEKYFFVLGTQNSGKTTFIKQMLIKDKKNLLKVAFIGEKIINALPTASQFIVESKEQLKEIIEHIERNTFSKVYVELSNKEYIASMNIIVKTKISFIICESNSHYNLTKLIKEKILFLASTFFIIISKIDKKQGRCELAFTIALRYNIPILMVVNNKKVQKVDYNLLISRLMKFNPIIARAFELEMQNNKSGFTGFDSKHFEIICKTNIIINKSNKSKLIMETFEKIKTFLNKTEKKFPILIKFSKVYNLITKEELQHFISEFYNMSGRFKVLLNL